MNNGYSAFIQWELDASSAARTMVEKLKACGTGSAVIYAHDDPDGLCSAALLVDLLQRKSIEPEVFFPPSFALTEETVTNTIGDRIFDFLFIVDKGSLGHYGNFRRRFREVFVIDHHPLQGTIEGIHFFNPNAEGAYRSLSGSMLVHLLLTSLGWRSAWADLINLIGLKGDFAIEPATGIVSPYCEPFYREIEGTFRAILQPAEIEPTMFDVTQRNVSTELNRITELIHVVSGGGFQFFYKDRDPSLKEILEPELVFRNLLSIRAIADVTERIKSQADFLALVSPRAIFERIYGYFKEDWKSTSGHLDLTIPLLDIGKTRIFFLTGNRVPLMPMVGSVKIYELNRDGGSREAVGLYLNYLSDRLHMSARGTGTLVHCGTLCGTLAERLKGVTGEKSASGGGHPKAAECVWFGHTDRADLFLAELCRLLARMSDLTVKADRLSTEEESEFKALGLTFNQEKQ